MKEVHYEFRRYNPLNWDQPKIFRMYQLTEVKRLRGGIEIIKRAPDLFSYKEMVKTYRLRRRYRKEEKDPEQTWQSWVKELEASF